MCISVLVFVVLLPGLRSVDNTHFKYMTEIDDIKAITILSRIYSPCDAGLLLGDGRGVDEA